VSTPLQSSIQELTFSLQTDEKENDIDGAKVTFNTGALSEAWVGNCVCISHAAAVLSPHTNAPYRLLKLDIERLLELIPVESNLSMERKEFNRRFELDVIHAKLFSEALFDTRSALGETKPSSRDTDIHQISSNDVDDLLNRKIEQYLNRGFIVSYDYEPFNTEDWKILHSGMRRKPRRYDALCDGLDDATTRQKLAEIKNGIQVLVPKMPPCHIYTQKFKDYLLKKQ
jgi:tryptophan halogenase